MGSLKQDPIQLTDEYKLIEPELEAKIVARIGEKSHMGYCHLYWKAKQEILKEDYGIDWQSPSELNPGIMFD
jgi:hypothetical protein